MASLVIKLRCNLITMRYKLQSHNKSITLAKTFVIIQKGIITGQIYRTRKGADSQEVLLSRVMPPHSLGPPRYLNPKLKTFGSNLPLRKTGDVMIVICGMLVATVTAAYAE